MTIIERLKASTPPFWNAVARAGVLCAGIGLAVSEFGLPLPERIKLIGSYCTAIGVAIAAMSRFAIKDKLTYMYTEQPTPRYLGQTSDSFPLEYFEWRDTSTDPWTKEVQYIEPDVTAPNGFWVYWQNYTTLDQFSNVTKDGFKSNSFPRKPGKRGGSPQGS